MANSNKREILYNREADDNVMAFMEPEVIYAARRPEQSVANFLNMSAYLGFTQLEWAAILHISDRTLQRYLKDEKSFSGAQAEILFYLQRLIDASRQVFGEKQDFLHWLRSSKNVLGQSLNFDSLQSLSGIKMLHDELGRMAYGVYI